MRKFLSLLAVLVFYVMTATAQTRKVSGLVRDNAGAPVPFATISIKSTNTGTTADAEGRFTIQVKQGAVLVISAQGMKSQEVATDGQDVVSVSLEAGDASTLTEVVVTTAFGVKKAARTTPFSAQVITDDQLNTIRQPNLNNALAGKVAGVQFRGQSPVALNRQGSLRIRGGQSTTDVDPIYVVDGTIVNSFDINPDDVEDLTVLKGANATALFGSRAANGAIVITTKKKGARSGIGIELNQGMTFDRVYVMPEYQSLYAGGDGDFITFNWNASMPAEWQPLNGKPYHDFTDDASWGPRMDGQEYLPWYAFIPGHSRSFQSARLTPQPDNVRDFWETGITNNTNVSFATSGTGSNFRVSYTNQSVKGMLPNSASTRHNLFSTLTYDLGKHFTVGTNITFSTQKIRGEFNDGYANQSSGGFSQWFHRDLDMGIMKELRGLKTPSGTYASWNFRRNPNSFASFPDPTETVYAGNYWYNFYTYFDLLDQNLRRERLFGDAFITFKLNNDFRVKATIRKNQLTTNTENITPSALEASGKQTGILAAYLTEQTNYQEYNYEFLASYNKSFGDLAISVNAGANRLTTTFRTVKNETDNGLKIPDLYSIANSINPPIIENKREKEAANSLFAFGDFEYRKFLSLTWAIRNDWYSTLPANDNALLSPSLGAAFVFSEFTGSAIPWLSFGKVFGSWGKKPKTLTFNKLNLAYTVNQNTWNDFFLMETPNTLPDPDLRGSLVTTWETGLDLRFLQNRLGLNITYYVEDNKDEPVDVDISQVSGFSRKTINAADFHREGLEIELNAKPVSNKNFEWNITKTFAYLIDNTVEELAENLPSFTLSGGAFGTRFARAFHFAGKQWGTLKGGGIKRNEDGLPLITTNGFSGGPGWFVADADKEWGSIVPKVTGGLQNFLSYKNFTLGMTIDYQFGGKFFSLSEMWGSFSGLLAPTAATNANGKNVRDDVGDGGGVRVQGVDAADGKTAVDVYISAYDYFHQFYYQRIAEPFVHDLTFIKLRELSLGYKIPVNKIGKLGNVFQGAHFSLIARNPWLIYRKSDNFDPSEITFNHGEDGQFPGTRSIGFNLRLNF
jgi:TonB-linked SusC/RagA family outer membrane protein